MEIVKGFTFNPRGRAPTPKYVYTKVILPEAGKHDDKWDLSVFPEKPGGKDIIATPGLYMMRLVLDDNACEDWYPIPVYDLNYFMRIYDRWIKYFDNAVYGLNKVKLGDKSWEAPFMRALRSMTDRLWFKYYHDFIGKTRFFHNPCWALAVSVRMAEYMDAGLRSSNTKEGWAEWRAIGLEYNNSLADTDPKNAAWSRVAQVVKALKSLQHAMYLEQVDGLAEGLRAAGPNRCCEHEFDEWATTATEVTGLMDFDILLAAKLHGAFLERKGFPPLQMKELAPNFYKRARRIAADNGWKDCK